MARPPTNTIDYPHIIFDETDINKQLVWHQSRMATRLESHQRRSVIQINQLVLDDDTVYNLGAIRLAGATRTQPDFLSPILESVLTKDKPQKLSEIISAADELHSRLSALDLFSSIKLGIQPVADGKLNELELRLAVSERGRFFLKTSTDIGSGEGALTGLARARNLLGRGELLEGSVGLGSQTRASFQLRAEKPVLGGRAKLELAGFGAERDFGSFASCSESVRGLVAKFKVSE